MFGVQMLQVYGTSGEFSVGSGASAVRAQYLLTKMRPGGDGSWESELAAHMVPWREVFKIEELSFDELLQRDLDDSRVAHDLIPYLLGKQGDQARFFPPILAIVVPKKPSGSGISPYYSPSRELDTDDLVGQRYGDLFEFGNIKFNNTLTPLASLKYNRQQTSFVIVDGQHRAMAVLALHRQLTDSWGKNAFASYYNHLKVEAADVSHIELPVCVVFFPDLQENHPNLKQGIDLKTICREIFLVVNRSAKPVSQSRELLLDDDDLAARMMRTTLSHFKDRPAENLNLMRVYSVAYGDADEDLGKQVVAGSFQVTSAVAIHKLHCAMSFALPRCYKWADWADASDKRNVANPNTPVELLSGTELDYLSSLSRRGGRTLEPEVAQQAVAALGSLNNKVILSLFDEFRPYTIHNSELSRLKMKLSDPNIRADVVQQKCYSLLFEGSGVRGVFESHLQRLRDEEKQSKDEGKPVPAHVRQQVEHFETVAKALSIHEREFQKRRTCEVAGLDYTAFLSTGSDDEWRFVEDWGRRLYTTTATQAFQLGYVMAVFSTVKEWDSVDIRYEQRAAFVQFVAATFLAGLNRYFSPDESTAHRTLKGFITTPRAGVFDLSKPGLRSLLAMSVAELNERRWDFFRYVIVELALSEHGLPGVEQHLSTPENKAQAEGFVGILPQLLEGLDSYRNKLVAAAQRCAVEAGDFKLRVERQIAEARGAGKSEVELDALKQSMLDEQEHQARENALVHLRASLGKNHEDPARLQRLNQALLRS